MTTMKRAAAADTMEGLAAMALESLSLPADAHVIGEQVTVTGVRNPGLAHVGLRATCRRGEHSFDVSLADIVFPPASAQRKFVERYRGSLGLPTSQGVAAGPVRAHKVEVGEIAVGEPVDLVVLEQKTNVLRCRTLGTVRQVTLRTAPFDAVPGTIITVTPTKSWTYGRHPYLSGKVERMRVDAALLGLTPLALRDEGEWDPEEEYWGEDGEQLEACYLPIVARGRRPQFEMEQVLPGVDPDDFDTDPILDAVDLRAAGDVAGAQEVLSKLLTQDLRCLDAHAHLGSLYFKSIPRVAARHYAVGAAIGELSLGPSFEGVLAWGLIDNRPYLRCLHGLGLCSWRLGDFERAREIFTRMLWLNPGDHQGVRGCLPAVEAGRPWEPDFDDD